MKDEVRRTVAMPVKSKGRRTVRKTQVYRVRREVELGRSRNHRTREYSKRLLTGLVAAWFAGLVYGMVFCLLQWRTTPDNTAIAELLTYIGAPMSCGVVGYLIKSAMENRIKLQKNDLDAGEDLF